MFPQSSIPVAIGHDAAVTKQIPTDLTTTDNNKPVLLPILGRGCNWNIEWSSDDESDWDDSDSRSIDLGSYLVDSCEDFAAFVNSPFGGPMSTSKCVPHTPAATILPALTTGADAPLIYAQFFSNELFFADSLSNLPAMFQNYAFPSFSQSSVLFPCPTIPFFVDHDLFRGYRALYRRLLSLETDALKLAAAVTAFNRELQQIPKREPSLNSLIHAKQQLLGLVARHLGGGFHFITDIIINSLYDCNLQAETLAVQLPKDLSVKRVHQLDKSGADLLQDMSFCHARIESILKAALPDLGAKDTMEFSRWIDTEFIHNKGYAELADLLRQEYHSHKV